MSFYSDFAEHYEAVFPFREVVLRFLRAHLPTAEGGADRAPRRRGRILDLGCGTGHYCGRLAALGHEAIGIDLDPAMIAAATRAYPDATFECLDMIAMDRLPPPFDLIYCIGNVLPHLPSARLPELLAKVTRALAPGGAWIFQTVNWDFVLGLAGASYRFPDRALAGGLVFRREYRDVTPQRLRFRAELTAPDRVLFAGEVELYPVTAEDYRRLNEAAGFTLVEHQGDFAGVSFQADAEGGSVFAFRKRGTAD